MSEKSSLIITSGFSSTIIGYNQSNSEIIDQRILHNDELSSNHSFMVANKNVHGVFYVVHEVDEFNGEKSGAISRWKLQSDNSFVKNEVQYLDISHGPLALF